MESVGNVGAGKGKEMVKWKEWEHGGGEGVECLAVGLDSHRLLFQGRVKDIGEEEGKDVGLRTQKVPSKLVVNIEKEKIVKEEKGGVMNLKNFFSKYVYKGDVLSK